jgi:hypothetical protein
MNERFCLLHQKLTDERRAFNVQSAMLHQLTADAPAALVFAAGTGAGQVFNMIDVLLYILDQHKPTSGSNFCGTCSGDNAPVRWPCSTAEAIATLYRHDHEFVNLWR